MSNNPQDNICPTCGGDGRSVSGILRDGATAWGTYCPTCNGTGYVNPMETTAKATSPVCPTCDGKRYVEYSDGSRLNCSYCGGTGTVQPQKPKVQIKKFEQCLDTQCSTCHPTPDTKSVYNTDVVIKTCPTCLGLKYTWAQAPDGGEPIQTSCPTCFERGTVQPPKPNKHTCDTCSGRFSDAGFTLNPTPDTNWNKEAPNSNLTPDSGITDTTDSKLHEIVSVKLTDRQLLHKFLGGQSGEIIDRIDDMELLLEILKICERRRG